MLGEGLGGRHGVNAHTYVRQGRWHCQLWEKNERTTGRRQKALPVLHCKELFMVQGRVGGLETHYGSYEAQKCSLKGYSMARGEKKLGADGEVSMLPRLGLNQAQETTEIPNSAQDFRRHYLNVDVPRES